MARGEIACFEQFLLLSLYVFKKLSAAEASDSVYLSVNPFPKTAIMKQSTLKSLKQKNRKSVESILATGEITPFDQFLLLSLCFQKLSAAEASESIYMWERVNCISNCRPILTPLQKTNLKTCQKGKLHEQFLLWLRCFQLYSIFILLLIEMLTSFCLIFSMLSAADLL